jgi:serine/threonine protein kinase
MTNVLALTSGTELVGDFCIERVLGAGGFGMTYLAREIALNRQVTIKEYFPSDFALRGEGQAVVARDGDAAADFQWGLDRFIDEAQALAKFDHPNICRVYRYFRANGTAYMVLTFEEGQSLKGWLRWLGRAPRQRELDDVLAPLLDALETVHAADYLHRDIAPDNIIVRKDGSPVLIDFGSARGEIAARTRTVSALVKPGYSPYEQYAESGTRQGPWTDIYALGATLFHAISGKRPADAPSRVVRDELPSMEDVALAAYRPRFLAAVDRALMLDPDSRPQSIASWRGDLLAPEPAKPGWFQRAANRAAEPPAPGSRPGSGSPTVKLTVQPGVAPPPPDAPGAPGQMLDYIDGLKQKGEEAPLSPLAAQKQLSDQQRATPQSRGGPAVAPPATPSPADAAQLKSPSKPSRASASPASEKLPVSLPPRTRPPRPKPVRAAGAKTWRSFAIKFVIGATIAGWAIAYKDEMPGFLRSVESTNVQPSRVVEKAAVARVAPGHTIAARLTMLSGHRGAVTAVGFTTDGQVVVTAGADGRVKVWNAATGRDLRTIEPSEGEITGMAVSGRRVLTGHSAGRVVLWDVDTGQRVASYKHGEATVAAVAFSRDGRRLIVSNADASLAVWDPDVTQSPIGVVAAHEGAVTAVAYAERGPYIATGGDDANVRLWRAGDLSLVRTYRSHREAISALAFSPDGRYLAAAAVDGRIRVWSTSSSSLYRLNAQNKGRVQGLAFSPAGDMLASAADDGTVQLWHLRQSRAVRSTSEGSTPARAVAFTPDGSRAAVASNDGKVRFWDAAPPVRTSR